MNEKDFEYLNSINTMPGPNAGRSIDSSKPGLDADAAALAQSDAKPESYGDQLRRVMKRQAMQSDAEPVYFHRFEDTKAWAECDHDDYEVARKQGCYETRVLYTAPPRPDASEIEQLKAELRNTWQRLETTLASEKGWKKRCQFVEAERDDARASRSPDASAGLIAAAEIALAIRGNAYLWAVTHAGQEGFLTACNKIAEALRARAATDRSGK